MNFYMLFNDVYSSFHTCNIDCIQRIMYCNYGSYQFNNNDYNFDGFYVICYSFFYMEYIFQK